MVADGPAYLTTQEGVRMPSKLRSLYQAHRPEIHINLNSKQKTYTTMDRLEGTITISTPVDLPFDAVEIEFVGTARTFVERVTTAMAVNGRSEAFHQFLKLQQPMSPSQYPEDRIFKAGESYEFPFLFVVPAQLLPKIWTHPVVSPNVRDVHLQLPPTFGDKETSKAQSIDDMAPEMASIKYGIFARVTKQRVQNGQLIRTTLASTARRLRIAPAAMEQPPLEIRADDEQYVLRKEKTIRKGMLKGKLGTLIMEATQPPVLRLPARDRADAESPSTMVTIQLRFEPADETSSPPRLGSLTNKLKICTYFACTARHDYPRKAHNAFDPSQGFHSEQISLSSRCIANAEWTKHDPQDPGPFERRDSGLSLSSVSSASSIPRPSASFKSGVYYTATLLVPATLPSCSQKSLPPTFHSCLISRTYLLKLELSLHNSGIPGSSLELRVPFQITRAAPSPEDLAISMSRQGSTDSAMETEVDAQDARDFFEPRVIRSPEGEYVGRSRIGSTAPVAEESDGPPGYSFLAARAQVQAGDGQ